VKCGDRIKEGIQVSDIPHRFRKWGMGTKLSINRHGLCQGKRKVFCNRSPVGPKALSMRKNESYDS
jgi:hypothetical protein